MLTRYTVKQGDQRLTVWAISSTDAICRAMDQLKHIGGITAQKAGDA